MISDTLKFSSNVKFDIEKLIVGGHSFGGMTALYTAFRDDRVKGVFGFDAWVWTVLPKIMANKLIVK